MTSLPSCIPFSCYDIPSDLLATLPVCEETLAPTTAAADITFEQTLELIGLPPPGRWSWDWFTYPIPDEKFETFVTGYAAGGVMLGIILVALSYPLFDRFWTARSQTFSNLPNEQQVVVIQHSIEALFLSLFFIPMTWAMLSSNFQVPFSKKFDKIRTSFIGCYMIWIVTTYFVELASRYKNIRALVLVHHLCAAANAVLPLFVLTLTNVRCASVLTYFITLEAPVFLGLIMYRLYPSNKWTPTVIWSGMWIFGLSRPVQMGWILLIVIEHWDTSEAWQCIVQVIFGVLFSSLQLYTLVIHNTLLKKTLKAQRECRKQIHVDEENAVDNGAGTDDSSRALPAHPGAIEHHEATQGPLDLETSGKPELSIEC